MMLTRAEIDRSIAKYEGRRDLRSLRRILEIARFKRDEAMRIGIRALAESYWHDSLRIEAAIRRVGGLAQ